MQFNIFRKHYIQLYLWGRELNEIFKNIIKNKAKKKIKNIKFICRKIINTTEEFSYNKYKYEHICTHNHETDDKFEDDNDDEYMYIFKRTRKQERTYHY